MTTDKLQELLQKEIELCGLYVWSDKRKTLEEMLRMRGVKI